MTTVTLENYGALAWRTAKQMQFNEMMLHGALGLLTEVAELSVANLQLKDKDYIIKELGDIVWFANYIHTTYTGGFLNLVAPLPDSSGLPFSGECFALLDGAGAIGTAIKANVFYGKPIDTAAMEANLHDVIVSVYFMSQGFTVPFEAVLQTNIDKLALRYPEKYTDAAAIARGDEAAEAGAGYINQD